MKIKWGALMVDGRGKIGGQVASKNRAGAYMRNKVTPVNQQTSYQLTVRNRLSYYSQNWRGLTQAQRDAWVAAVSDFQRTDIFGDLRSPTGFNLYQRLNNNLEQVGQAAITSPPLAGSVGQVVTNSLTAEDGTVAESLSLALAAAVPANTAIKIFATAPQSAGKNFVKSEYRLIGSKGNGEATPIDLLALYQAKYGSTGAVGQKIFVKVVAVNETTGQTGTPSEVSTLVTASA